MADEITNHRYGRRVYQGSAAPFWDKVTSSFPSDTTEIRTYSSTNKDTGATEVRAIYLITYTTSTKLFIDSAVKTFGE